MSVSCGLRRIAGPPRLVARVEQTLGCVAVVAAGVPGRGPWRLITARYDRIRASVATLQLGALGQKLAIGAVVMTDADVFAKKLLAVAEADVRAGSGLEPPWFLHDGGALTVLLKHAALKTDVKAFEYEAYAARVEALVRKELGT